jgi:hypothetical protein
VRCTRPGGVQPHDSVGGEQFVAELAVDLLIDHG